MEEGGRRKAGGKRRCLTMRDRSAWVSTVDMSIPSIRMRPDPGRAWKEERLVDWGELLRLGIWKLYWLQGVPKLMCFCRSLQT
jgi:hypothetical protein